MKHNKYSEDPDSELQRVDEESESTAIDARLIELIYEAPIEKEPWTSFLHYFRTRINADSVLMSFRLPWDDGESIDIDDSQWYDRTIRELYYKKYSAQNPLDYEAMRVGCIYSFEDFVSREEFIETPFYKEFCEPLRIEYAFAVYLGDYNGLRTWISCSRGKDRGAFTAAEIDYSRRAIPHLQRALNIFSLLEQYKSSKSIYSKTIDSMNIGAVLLDRSGSITEKNGSAEAIIAENRCVTEHNYRLAFLSPSDHQRYEYLIATLLDEHSSTDYESMVAGNGSDRLSLLMRKIRRLTSDEFVHAPAVIVYLKQPMQEQAIAATRLVSSLFGLTTTEARLAVMLANGQTLDEVRNNLGVTEQTARTYCKRVFAKTGTNRQAELVRLVLTSLANLV